MLQIRMHAARRQAHVSSARDGRRVAAKESYEDRWFGCPGHRGESWTGPGIRPGAGQPGAAKVYGAARHADAVTEPGVTPVALDITDEEGVA
jgi:hypothetical protein